MLYDVKPEDLYVRNESIHWGNPLVLQRVYKYTHAAPTQHLSGGKLILLDGSVEELKKGSKLFSFGGGTTCTYLCRGFTWDSKDSKHELHAFLSVESGNIPKRKWMRTSGCTTPGPSLHVMNLATALSEGYLFYKSFSGRLPVVSSSASLNFN